MKRYQRIHHIKIQILVHNETLVGNYNLLQHIKIIQGINVQDTEVQLYIIVLRALTLNESTSVKARVPLHLVHTFILYQLTFHI